MKTILYPVTAVIVTGIIALSIMTNSFLPIGISAIICLFAAVVITEK